MENMLSEWLSLHVYAWLLIFSRVGTAFMVMPGVGEGFVLARARLFLALGVSALLSPVLLKELPPQPDHILGLSALVAGEIFYGFFLGMVSRLIMATLEVAGMFIAMQLSLANATVFNPSMATQSSLVGALLGIVAIVLFFAADLHHLLLLAIADSYTLFIPGQFPVFQDFAATYALMFSESFTIAAQLASPFIVLGLVFYLGLGLLSRLMPQLQIFFLAIPIQIYFGLMLMGLVISTMMLVWLNYAQTTLLNFLDL